ncbi:PREDICTED: condensin complex subunit 1-like, partial [Priapulus caudatus]|uniref:Condensin complex subunit 1-like n=1 Tax=Priapulus caudatus TaxID=37621 RepID=A0ABM1F7D0_PRICU
MPLVCQLLGSRSSTDVLEAIEFFATAAEFHVSGAVVGVRRALVLVWSKEQPIREALSAAYRRLYLETGDDDAGAAGNQRAQTLTVVKNLTALIDGATLAELTSLEQL